MQVHTLPTVQVPSALTFFFLWGHDPFTHACKARTDVGWTFLSVSLSFSLQGLSLTENSDHLVSDRGCKQYTVPRMAQGSRVHCSVLCECCFRNIHSFALISCFARWLSHRRIDFHRVVPRSFYSFRERLQQIQHVTHCFFSLNVSFGGQKSLDGTALVCGNCHHGDEVFDAAIDHLLPF